jgi:thiosulfate dehydrogenase [quinone] large subunit
MNDSNQDKSCDPSCDFTLAFLVLRLWLAIRAIVTGIEKYSAFNTIQKPLIDPTTGMEDPSGAMVEVQVKYYAMTNYSGVPASLKNQFANEPLLPHPMLNAFDHILGPALIATGVMLLLGFGTRLSLFVQGLIYCGLTVGLILIKQDAGVSALGVHIALVALALSLARFNKLALLKKW